MSWLGDNVYSIREAATVNLKRLTEVFGVEWARQAIVPKVLQMGGHPNYLYRMTTIFAITNLAPTLTPEVISQSVLGTVLAMVNDPIPNIRFNVAKSLETLTATLVKSKEGKDDVTARIFPALQMLKGDVDPDVRYFAGKAFEQSHQLVAA